MGLVNERHYMQHFCFTPEGNAAYVHIYGLWIAAEVMTASNVSCIPAQLTMTDLPYFCASGV
jgi:hypothetical protein